MGFWIFMLIANLLCPLSMIGFGSYFLKSAGPAEINMLFGYRTTMSMKNESTWRFAHMYSGKLYRTLGFIITPLSAIAMFFVIGMDDDTVGLFGALICGVQVIFLIMPIIPTEITLRKKFNKDGTNRD